MSGQEGRGLERAGMERVIKQPGSDAGFFGMIEGYE